MLKKQVSALGNDWSVTFSFIIGLIMNLMLFLSNSSLFIGKRYCPQQNFITLSLSASSISLITYQKYFMRFSYSLRPPAYFVCFLNKSTSTFGLPHTINFN